jgi:hypothetical protein
LTTAPPRISVIVVGEEVAAAFVPAVAPPVAGGPVGIAGDVACGEPAGGFAEPGDLGEPTMG